MERSTKVSIEITLHNCLDGGQEVHGSFTISTFLIQLQFVSLLHRIVLKLKYFPLIFQLNLEFSRWCCSELFTSVTVETVTETLFKLFVSQTSGTAARARGVSLCMAYICVRRRLWCMVVVLFLVQFTLHRFINTCSLFVYPLLSIHFTNVRL